MKSALERLVSFRQSLGNEPVRLHIYNDHSWVEPIDPSHAPGKSWSSFAKNVLMYIGAACVAYGVYEYATVRQAVSQGGSEGDWVEIQTEQTEPFTEEMSPRERSMLEVRHKLNFIEATYRGRKVMLLDMPSRILLTKKAADNADLENTGLSWKDLYGVIHAETAWVPRDGLGKNKVISQGLAQMEPATAKSLGIKNPNDEVDAIFGAAHLLKEAAQWSRAKVARLKLPPHEKAKKLREGVSIYYNLSTSLKRTWTGENTHEMPDETNFHIKNAREGAALAGLMDTKINKARLIQVANQRQQDVDDTQLRQSAYRSAERSR